MSKIKEIFYKIINYIGQYFKSNDIPKLDDFTYDKLVALMKEKGTLQEFENELNEFEDIERLMQNKTSLHGINHVIRVFFNAYALVTMGNVKERDKKIIIEAAKLHDIGRKTDGEDTIHGQEGAEKARKVLENKGLSKEEVDQICFLIKEHSLPKQTNLEHIANLPSDVRENYRYCLEILKDADKLDRCRIGDLDINRLSTQNAKKLIHISQENFENNRYYYKKKMEVYAVDEENAKSILQLIQEKNPVMNISIDDIIKDYSTYKLLQDDKKIKWFNVYSDRLKEKVSLPEFINIISKVTYEDMIFLQDYFHCGGEIIIEAINTMGINKYFQLKDNNKLYLLMHIKNYENLKMTADERESLLQISKYGVSPFKSHFFIFHSFVEKNNKELIDTLIQSEKDHFEYTQKLRGGNNGYKLEESMIDLSPYTKTLAIEKADKELIMDIKNKCDIPLNIILLALVDLELIFDDIDRKDLEKILINYHKLYLNTADGKDKDQVRSLLLDLPEELDESEAELVRKCTMGNLKRFKLNSYKQLKDYKQVIDEMILQEFENTEDVEVLRNIVIESKINNIKNLKRDLSYYQRYLGQSGNESNIVQLFNTLFTTESKDELLTVYNELNASKEDFDFDALMEGVREELKNISRKDVVNQMNLMLDKIKGTDTVEKDGANVIDLTGTDFNLLISVIGSMGSPYITQWHNSQVRRINRFTNNKVLYHILGKKFDFERKHTVKKMVGKRFKFDPMKNKQRCVSSIDQDFIGHVPSEEFMEKKQPKEKLILAYFPKQEDQVFWMGSHDLMTIYDKDRSDKSRRRVPHKDNMDDVCNLKLEDLNNTTMGNDNEIIIDSYPGAVVCFDKVSNISKRTAEKHNIPILYIDSIEQLKFMQRKVFEYYDKMEEDLSTVKIVSDEMFDQSFNQNFKDNNIVHRAFKIINGFCFLDEDMLPKKEFKDIIDKMNSLLKQYIAKCDDKQKILIQDIIDEETNINLARYNRRFRDSVDYYQYDDFVENAQKDNDQAVK